MPSYPDHCYCLPSIGIQLLPFHAFRFGPIPSNSLRPFHCDPIPCRSILSSPSAAVLSGPNRSTPDDAVRFFALLYGPIQFSRSDPIPSASIPSTPAVALLCPPLECYPFQPIPCCLLLCYPVQCAALPSQRWVGPGRAQSDPSVRGVSPSSVSTQGCESTTPDTGCCPCPARRCRFRCPPRWCRSADPHPVRFAGRPGSTGG